MKTKSLERQRLNNMSLKNYELRKKEFGLKLKELRLNAGILSPFQVALELEKSKDTIYWNEKGKYLPSRQTIKLICKLYGVDKKVVNELLDERTEIKELELGARNK